MSSISSGTGPSFQNISFAANSCHPTLTTYLFAGNELEQPSVTSRTIQPIRVPAGKTAKLSLFEITASANPTVAKTTFTLQKNSPGDGNQAAPVDTVLSLDLPPAPSAVKIVRDDIQTVSVLDGDEITVIVRPAAGQLLGPQGGVMAVMLLTIE